MLWFDEPSREGGGDEGPDGRRSAGGRTARRFARSGPQLAIALFATLAMFVCAAGSASARPLRLVAFGDSLTAGYMLPEADGFAPKLQKALRAQGYDVTVINGGVSGDTTTGGLARLDWTLGEGTDAVILELGANDMLRGIDPKVPERNLSEMLGRLKARRIPVLLAGIHALPSMGSDYAAKFNPIFATLAKRYDVALYPFFLEGIIGDRSQHLPDGMHPNARGIDTVVANILPSVDALLKGIGSRS